MKNYSQLFVFLFILFAISCTKPPDYPDTPVLEFVSLSRTQIPQGTGTNAEDQIWVNIDFTDGDGDLGRETTENKQLFIIDTHFNQNTVTEVSVPFIPEQGAGNGVSGTLSVAAFTSCCVPPVGPPCSVLPDFPIDTMILEIYMVDRAGNESNHIFTDPIILLCQ